VAQKMKVRSLDFVLGFRKYQVADKLNFSMSTVGAGFSWDG